MNILTKIKQVLNFSKQKGKPRDRYIPKDQYLAAVFTITYRCQCSCAHCVSGSYTKNKQDEFTTIEAKKVLKDLADFGVNCIVYYGGEPLLRKDILELVRYTHELGMFAQMDSNGWLLDEVMIKDLAEAGLGQVNISIDSLDSEVHDGERVLPGLFKRAVKAIELSKKYGITPQISAYADRGKLNSGNVESIIAFGKKLGVKLRYLAPLRSGKWNDNPDVVLNKEELARFKSMLSPDGAFWEANQCNSPEKDFYCLASAKAQFNITAYGDITPCPSIELSFGNLKEEPLEDILARMWKHRIFDYKVTYHCPMNDAEFRKQFIESLQNSKEIPVRIDKIERTEEEQ